MRVYEYVKLLCCAVCVTSAVNGQPIAFPGAEGFGKFTTGGRSGKVIFVTNLNDDGPGSLRDAVQKKTPRIIVFNVSGTIELASPLDINYGNVTIAGQTAPGDGICIKNFTTNIKADNVIIRFLRFRMGDEKRHEGDALSATKGKRNIIIDHCSMSWATDECGSFYNNENFTLQWCILSESLNKSIHTKGEHGYGGIWGGKKASFHHNLIASHSSRLPRFSGSSSTPNGPDELVDFRNNVIYNWGHNNVYGGEKGRYNVVNNYFKPGPATKASRRSHIINPWRPYGSFFISGNVLHGNEQVSQHNRQGIREANPDSLLSNEPFKVESLPEETAQQAYARVLADAGASFRRDGVDERITSEVASGISKSGKERNGIIDKPSEAGGWPQLRSVSPEKDGDEDGMADSWEMKNGLDPMDPADACTRTLDRSYDNIEVYINSLVKFAGDIQH